MTVTLSILAATTLTGAVEWARLFSYQLPSGQDPGLEAVLADLTEGRRLPGHTYRWTDYGVPVELVPARLLDTEHEADISHGRITGFHGVDLVPVVADYEVARAVLIELEDSGAGLRADRALGRGSVPAGARSVVPDSLAGALVGGLGTAAAGARPAGRGLTADTRHVHGGRAQGV